MADWSTPGLDNSWGQLKLFTSLPNLLALDNSPLNQLVTSQVVEWSTCRLVKSTHQQQI